MNRKLSDDEAERILADARDLLSHPLHSTREERREDTTAAPPVDHSPKWLSKKRGGRADAT
jgi:hypothetical protein